MAEWTGEDNRTDGFSDGYVNLDGNSLARDSPSRSWLKDHCAHHKHCYSRQLRYLDGS